MTTWRRGRSQALGLAILGCGVVLAGCFTGRTVVDSLAQVAPGEAVLVGRIELAPPLAGGEQQLKGLGTSGMKNRAVFITDDHWRDLPGDLSMSDYRGYVGGEFGQTFYVAVPTKPLYVLRGIMYIFLTGTRQEQAWLPGGLKVDVKPGDKAVYMGTIRYHRNEFMDITKVEIKDNFGAESAAFKKKFGDSTVLRKRLAVVIAPPAKG